MNSSTDLIKIVQLPIIEEHLKKLSVEIDEKIEHVNALVVSEDTVKDVKKVRADLNATFNELETQRKMVKQKVLEPYEAFENIYKTCVSDKFKSADQTLKVKIDDVESKLKTDKEEEVKSYFNEYLASKNIDFVNYEKANINVTLTASMKSLKETAKAFIDKIVDDLNLIDTQDHKAEILAEYKQTLNVSQAITSISSRIQREEQERARIAELEAKKKAEAENVAKVDEIVNKPKVEMATVEAPKVQETVYPSVVIRMKNVTKDQIEKVKDFFKREGIMYE